MIDQTTSLDTSALREVVALANSAYTVWVDETELGFVFHKLRHPCVRDAFRCVSAGEQAFGAMVKRIDLPIGARCRAPDMGVGGSVWRYGGAAAGWDKDAAYALFSVQGSRSTPVAVVNSQAVGFNRFGPALTVPLGFWRLARRLRVTADIGRTTGTAITPLTVVRIGGVQMLAAPWNPNTIGQHIDVDVWVSGSAQVTVFGTITYIFPPTATPTPVQIIQATGDFAIPTLLTADQAIEFGITETVVQTEHFALFDVLGQVVV